MFNKTMFSQFENCKDYKSKDTEVKFADAGEPTGSKPYDLATFDVKVEGTVCGKEYYPESYGGKTCFGQACDEGKVCLTCKGKGNIPECAASTRPMACVKGAFAGTIAFSDGVEPKKVFLLGLCSYIQSASVQVFNFDSVDKQVPAYIETNLSGDGGAATFLAKAEPAAFENLAAKCVALGNDLRGVVLGVVYKDIGGSTGIGGGLVGGVMGSYKTGKAIATADDVLIVTKNKCQGNIPRYAGYADGGLLSSNFADIKAALYCGYRLVPGETEMKPINQAFNSPSTFWTPEELKEAFNGAGSGLVCNFSLDKNNAPSNPGTNIMHGCSNSTPGEKVE
jgi:hypothetical protein